MKVQVEGLWEVCLATYGEQSEILGYVSGQFKIDAEEQAAITYAEAHRKPNNIIFVRPADITVESGGNFAFMSTDPLPDPPPKRPTVWDLIRRRDLFE